jgi:hypothetical protein
VSGPVVFVSDLGLRDEFVGVCHLVMARIAPDLRVVNLSHGVPPHDVHAGAMVLAHGIPYGGPDAIGLAVVDPGVGGTERDLVVATAAGPHLVGPDNGLLSLAWKALGGVTAAVAIDHAAIGATEVSAVFHGRDVFAPAAAYLAVGRGIETLGVAVDPASLTGIDIEDAETQPGRVHGAVLDVDRFGNIRLNVRPEDLERAQIPIGALVEVATTATSIRARHIVAYSDVQPTEWGLLVDAWGWVSVIRYEANAAAGMGVTRGDPVWIAAG